MSSPILTLFDYIEKAVRELQAALQYKNFYEIQIAFEKLKAFSKKFLH